MSRMTIAVSTDFSEISRSTLPVAAELARKFSAALRVVHQAETRLVPPGEVFEADLFIDALQSRLSFLVETEECFEGVDVSPLLVRGGAIQTYAEILEEEGVNLLVLATHRK